MPSKSSVSLPDETSGVLSFKKPDVIVEFQLEPSPRLLCTERHWLSLPRKVIPTLQNCVARIAIALYSSSKTIKNARVWECLLNTPVTMHWINPKDHHVKVIKLPSSIMYGTISRDSGFLLWDGWMGEKIAGEEALRIATLVSCCGDDDYDDSGGDGDGGDVSCNVCKCSLLEGIIVAHVTVFPRLWNKRKLTVTFSGWYPNRSSFPHSSRTQFQCFSIHQYYMYNIYLYLVCVILMWCCV